MLDLIWRRMEIVLKASVFTKRLHKNMRSCCSSSIKHNLETEGQQVLEVVLPYT